MPAPAVGAAIVAGASQLVGGLLGSSSAAAQNREERAWQERMASTQYQRAVQDMRAAGLNPAMLYGKGQLSSPVSGGARQDESKGVSEGVRAAGLVAAQVADINAARQLKEAEARRVDQGILIEWNDFMGENFDPDNPADQDLSRRGKLRMAARVQDIELAKKNATLAVANAKNVDMDTARLMVSKGLLETQATAAKLGIPEAEAWSRYWKGMGIGGVALEKMEGAGRIFSSFFPKFGSSVNFNPGARFGGSNSARSFPQAKKGVTRYYE